MPVSDLRFYFSGGGFPHGTIIVLCGLHTKFKNLKLSNMNNIEPGDRAKSIAEAVRTADLVSMLVFDGLGWSEISKKTGLLVREIKAKVGSVEGRALVEKASEQKLNVLASVPIANMAVRLARYEKMYEEAEDAKEKALALSGARDEFRLVQAGEKKNVEAPSIVINLGRDEGKRKIEVENADVRPSPDGDGISIKGIEERRGST